MRCRASRLLALWSLAIGLMIAFGCGLESDSSGSSGASVEDDILVARSTDGGVTWTAPAALNADASTDRGNDGGSQVATDGLGAWVAVWHSNDFPAQSDFDINVARSTNGGVTWEGEADLNTNARSDAGTDGFPQVTTDGRGTWVAVWESEDSLAGTIGTDRDILMARSTDDGATWTASAALNTNAASDAGDDQEARVTTDGRGTWVAVWRYDDL